MCEALTPLLINSFSKKKTNCPLGRRHLPVLFLIVSENSIVFNIKIKRSWIFQATLKNSIWMDEKFAWQILKKSLNSCYILFPYEVWENFVRKVKFEFSINPTEGSLYVRRTGGLRVLSTERERYIKNKNKGENLRLKRKY